MKKQLIFFVFSCFVLFLQENILLSIIYENENSIYLFGCGREFVTSASKNEKTFLLILFNFVPQHGFYCCFSLDNYSLLQLCP